MRTGDPSKRSVPVDGYLVMVARRAVCRRAVDPAGHSAIPVFTDTSGGKPAFLTTSVMGLTVCSSSDTLRQLPCVVHPTQVVQGSALHSGTAAVAVPQGGGYPPRFLPEPTRKPMGSRSILGGTVLRVAPPASFSPSGRFILNSEGPWYSSQIWVVGHFVLALLRIRHRASLSRRPLRSLFVQCEVVEATLCIVHHRANVQNQFHTLERLPEVEHACIRTSLSCRPCVVLFFEL